MIIKNYIIQSKVGDDWYDLFKFNNYDDCLNQFIQLKNDNFPNKLRVLRHFLIKDIEEVKINEKG